MHSQKLYCFAKPMNRRHSISFFSAKDRGSIMDAINHQGTDIEAKLLLHEIEDEINMTESFTLAGLVAPIQGDPLWHRDHLTI